MKFAPNEFVYFLQRRTSRRNFKLLARLIATLVVLVASYSALFQAFMAFEGREYSWLTGIYWTPTVMSTLGFGDVTFTTDFGKAFSIIVLLSGLVFLLILFPFIFIQFFQSEARVRRDLPSDTTGHVILSHYDAVTKAMISRFTKYRYAYVLVIEDLPQALQLHDSGIKVVLGALDNPETYRRIRVQQAAMVVTTAGDTLNTNIAFTVREVSSTVPIIATANLSASTDVLEMAECSRVLRLDQMMGSSFLQVREVSSRIMMRLFVLTRMPVILLLLLVAVALAARQVKRLPNVRSTIVSWSNFPKEFAIPENMFWGMRQNLRFWREPGSRMRLL